MKINFLKKEKNNEFQDNLQRPGISKYVVIVER